jgi:uncharacterized RDD family membrane protein YckC
MQLKADAAVRPAGLARRAVALIYESLLMAAVSLAGALPFVVVTHGLDREWSRPLFQLYLLALAGVYFMWQWCRGGRTLAMKTWRLRLVTRSASPLTYRHALKRFVYALLGTAAAGAGFLWALLDREGLFLHDRLSGTMIIMDDRDAAQRETP